MLSLFALAWMALGAENPPLERLIEEIRREVRPGDAMRNMRSIHATDRYFTFPKFQETARFLKGEMERIGLRNVEIVDTPADGVTQVGYWTMPMAWDVKSARLEIVGGGVADAWRVLADFQTIPASLGMWSGATPPGGIEAEVVEVKRADVKRIDSLGLKGKIALTEDNPANIKWLLVRAGAIGAINTFTENPTLRDGRQWINAWGDDGWAFTKRSTPLICFSITPRQADLLRGLMKKSPVRVKAAVNSRHYAGSYPYVTAVIPGTGPEEVLTLGHTAEQGAHDNATGVAATVEALATLHRLIAAGKLPRPKRSIRVLSMGEMYGSMHYVATNPERIRRTVAAMCMDTPAASYEIAGTEYTFYMNPHVAKDFTDAFIMKIASTYLPRVGRPWHEKEFTTGTDTYLAEPMVGIPTVWGYSGSGVETHHNSEDTPDRVDERSLRDITIIDAAFLYFVANAGPVEAEWLARQSESRGHAQLIEAAEKGREMVGYTFDHESQAVRSVLRLIDPAARAAFLSNRLTPMLNRLRRSASLQEERTASRKFWNEAPAEAARMIVKRKRFGTIPLDDLPHARWEGYPSGAWAAIPTIALYWCDGRRNLAEVARLTQLELGATNFDFVGYFRFLHRRGYVELAE